MSIRPPSRVRAGMTLIEIMVACFLLATGIFAGIGAIANAHFSSQRRMNTDLALAEIVNQLEITQAMDDTALQARFAGGDRVYFPITGLSAGDDPTVAGIATMPQPGVIERVQVYNGSLRRTCLRFAACWTDQSGPAWIEQWFFFTNRN